METPKSLKIYLAMSLTISVPLNLPPCQQRAFLILFFLMFLQSYCFQTAFSQLAEKFAVLSYFYSGESKILPQVRRAICHQNQSISLIWKAVASILHAKLNKASDFFIQKLVKKFPNGHQSQCQKLFNRNTERNSTETATTEFSTLCI